MRGRLAVLLFAVVATGALAQDLPLADGAERTAEVIREADTIHLPSGPFAGGAVPRLRLDGRITSRAWRIPERGQGTLARLAPLREALEKTGWEVVFDCAAEGCGGFDFRFATPVLPAPAMFVNLFDYRYLLARRSEEHAMLFVSRAGERAYVQLTHVGPAGTGAPPAVSEPEPGSAPEADDLAARLRAHGHVMLAGLDFASGAAALGPGPHADLAALARFLAETPDARIALVGHTDSVGGLEPNIALSQARAEAVRARLIQDHGTDAARIEARGVGYLAPIASNATPEGREANRRVEVVLLE
ncbi:OmpA family protein [Roseovarius autotrophicus]|uniref:OmpA family protein n=1 Tax=Roseovarius autotrophicus TaxID=2824121 RepID=UPI0019F37991|nr:OmpA family protein [Roseovarius autotrophicus]MBE0454951.1 OmpA family protein [Roseovarius sp.]